MPYARQYTMGEVRAILDALSENRNPHPPGGGAPPPAHTLGKHWAIPEEELKRRSCGFHPGQAPGPAVTSCFGTFDGVVQAVTAAINSPTGQAVLAQLDAGAGAVNSPAGGLPAGGGIMGKRFQRTQPASAANPGGTGTIFRGAQVTAVFVRFYRHAQAGGGERLWIQTAYPLNVMGGAGVVI